MADINSIITGTSSAMLFHGPDALAQTQDASAFYGRVLLTVGGEKLLKEDSRGAISVHLNPPVYDRPGALVIGPMDKATSAASDSLLKMVEEPNPLARPFLWAHDLGSVSPTIRSRCLTFYAPGSATVLATVTDTLKDAVRGDPVAIRDLIKGDYSPAELAERVTQYISTKPLNQARLELWLRLRPLLGRETPTGVASALLGRRQ
jgi:hypothetical protein